MSVDLDQPQVITKDQWASLSRPKYQRSARLAFEVGRICRLSQHGIYQQWLNEYLLTMPTVIRTS